MRDYDVYLAKVVKFLSYRPRSEKEVRDYLQKKNAPQEISEQIIHFLTEKRFLNDEEFVLSWIRQRLQYRPKSFRLIKLELKQKGIDHELIEAVIRNSQSIRPAQDKSAIENPTSDLETAKKLVEKKIGKYKHLSKQEIYQKLGGFLARRGFDWETIKKSIDGADKTERG